MKELIVPKQNHKRPKETVKVKKQYLEFYEESAKKRITEVLFRYPKKEFSLSDLAKEARVAKANIGEILKEFQELKLITIEKLSKIWRIRANQINLFFIRTKIIYNLDFIYKSGLVEFLIDHYDNPKAIILFGSFRKGEDLSNSDIDIAIELNNNDYKIIRLNILADFEKLIGRQINLHLFDRNSIDIHLFNNIANGILLWGFLEVKK